MKIIRNGFTLHYIEQGERSMSPLLVIGSAIYYPKLFSHDIYKNLNIIFMDNRGFSEARSDNEYELSMIVEDIEAMRKELEIDTMFILGHSGHGFMAMAYADKYPEHVLGVILSNLAPSNTKERQAQSIEYFEKTASEDRKQYFYKEIAQLESDINNDPNNRFSHMNIRMQAHAFYDYTYDGAYLWHDVYNNLDALDYLWGDAFATYPTQKFINNTKIPILLLLSDYDYLVAPSELWTPIIKDTDVKLVKFEKSGHNPMLEEAEKYYKTIHEFIKKQSL